MEWLADEKVKHRVVGVAVLLSILLVIMPAMIKKSNQRLDAQMNLVVHLPKKPAFPDVDATKVKTVFQSVQVAHVDIPEVKSNPKQEMASRAESLSAKITQPTSVLQKVPVLAKETPPVATSEPKPVVASVILPKPSPVVAIKSRPVKPVVRVAVKPPVVIPKAQVFAVQIAAFASQDNALALVRELNRKGFRASYDKHGARFRVLVGQLNQVEQARHLQKQIASATQMNGFIVKVG